MYKISNSIIIFLIFVFIKNDTEKKQLRIFASAEAFGYGPCSKLTCIVKELRNEIPDIRVDFLGEESALNFALKNNYLFNSVKEYNGTYPDSNDFDLVLSVMNPYTILWGWFYRKKCIYVDSLYWFWKFEEKNYEKYESIIDELTNAASIDEVWALIKDVAGHNLHYIAHRLSTISCSQYFNDTDHELDVFRKKIKNIVNVNPIVDVSYLRKTKRDTILISLGGLLSPLNQEKEVIAYINLVFKIIEDFLHEVSERFNIVLTINPEIIKFIKKVPQNITVVSLSQEEMLKMINRSVLVLASAGITTMYECLVYETPFFVLPELHDGHYPNYLRLAGDDKEKIEQMPEVFPSALMNPLIDNKQDSDPDDEIRKIQSYIKKVNITNNKLLQEMKSSVNNLLTLVVNPDSLKNMVKRQKDFVLGQNTNKNKSVINVIKKEIENNNLPTVCKKHLVGIISSAIPIQNQKQIDIFVALGTNLAKHNINIATGAAIGISHLVGKAARDAGSKLVGFSPCSNALTHSRQADNAPINHFDNIHFNDDGFTARSLEFISSVDALIMVAGRMGTLSEFTIGFEEGIKVFILKGYGGVSDHMEQIISHTNKEGIIPPVISADTNNLTVKLLQFLNSGYYQ